MKITKDQIRSFYNLPPIDHDKSFKSTLDDLYDFQYEIKDKYTDYQLPFNSITTTATTLLSKMESLSLSEQNDNIIRSPPPFQHYFPPKLKSPPTTSLSSSSSSTTQNNVEDDSPSVIEFKKQLEKKQSKTPFVLGTPKAIEEAGKLFVSTINLSISQYQIIQEREKWIKNEDLKRMKQYDHPILHKVELFYNSIVQNLPNIATTLLEQLLIMAPTPSTPIHDSMDWNNNNNSNECTDIIRNRQIIRTTISFIIILLLKWFKTSHVMKFEYFSQLLVDNGYLMLSIRSLMIEDIKTMNESNVDNQKYGFFKQINLMNFNHEEGGFSSSTCSSSSSFSIPYSWEEPEQEKEDLDSIPYNQRNKDWLLNTLRILQMITKRKPLRNRILAKYKAFIPLKRITKYNKNSIEELYALKVLKSQVRYLGHKWREENMKIISAISRRCSMNLRDDWLSQCDNDNDNMNNNNYNELKLEDNMRRLVKLYHDHQYDVNTETTMDQNDNDLKTKTNGNGHCNGIDDNAARNGLIQKINQLFKQPLQRRIESKNMIQVPFETDGWDAPTPITTGSNKLLKKKKNDDIEDDDDIDTDDEEEENENRIMNGKNKNDPLENIDWSNLTEDELNTRINLVGEQTEQRWMNVDLNDPAYCKVLLDVETEIDDELIVTNDTFDDDIDVDPWSS
ncbi:hypothetical protein INT45_001596 [Circinella minor]|uniref:Far11/STRP C-terminal domain-containing protein n=1 Tax=Circinella minor TaxID=1195481 RepID=A0A8H7S581_9FUNG|nr:hypothetical protein INT45_001596 [Circinella minor]